MEEYQVPFLSIDESTTVIDYPIQATESSPCPICLSNEALIFLNECHHKFCESCLVSYMDLKILEAQVNEITCPTCSSKIPDNTIESLISPKNFKKYKNFLKIKQLELDIYVKWCPVADCKGYDIASEDNIKLTCNECGHKYCYSCSGEWHKGKCKDNTELSFKLWAMGNNLKICPRCKNHVQKNGGCPHMTCPRCQFQWCWRCGKSLLSNHSHNDLACAVGRSWFDLYWGIIVLLLLFPVLFPFVFCIGCIFIYETQDIDESEFFSFFRSFKYRVFCYILLFCISPAVEALFLAGYFLVLVCFLCEFFSRKYSILCPFGIIAAVLIGSLIAIALILAIILSPIVGTFFLTLKLFFTFKNCLVKKKAIEYPLSLI